MVLMILAGLLFVGISTLYTFHVLNLIFKYLNCKYKKIISLILAIILSLPAFQIFGLYALVYLYLLAFILIFEIILKLMKKQSLKSLLISIGISILCVSVLLTYGYFNMKHVIVTNYQINTNKIDKTNFLVISDLHMGNTMNSNELNQEIKKINKNIYSDYVFLVGDIVDERTSVSDMKQAFQLLGKLNHKYGIYYVYGNHDDNQYIKVPHFTHLDIKEEANKNKIHVLEDEVVNIHGISIIGRKDYSDKSRLSIDDLVKQATSKYKVVLDHQPVDYDNTSKLVDMQISGHTHGGQIFPVGQVQSILNGTPRYGLKKIGDFNGVTTSGIAGWGYPIKIGAPAEVVSIKIN